MGMGRTHHDDEPIAGAGMKPFERTLLRLHSSIGSMLPGPELDAHPLSVVASASPMLRIAWSQLHPSVHPFWLSERENVDEKVRPEQHQRTAQRADRKAQQIESMVSIAVMLAMSCEEATPHLVDFAGGSGPLALVLASLLPSCLITIVDVKQRSLDLAVSRARQAGLSNVCRHSSPHRLSTLATAPHSHL